MSILKLLHTHLDLENRSVQDLTETEIIRIEKKLKADVKLNQNLDLNEVEMILAILRNHLSELKVLYHPWYRKLREILINPNSFSVSSQQEPFRLVVDEKFVDFVSTYFGKTLLGYASLCFQQEHFNALNTLLLYKEILPSSLIEDLSKKCLQKIQFATECVNLKTSGLQTKIDCITNPFFYRVLNKFGAIHYESAMIDLLNISIENLQRTNRALFIRFLYAAGFFEPLRNDTKQVFQDNQKMAFNHGAREKVYGAFDKDQKGGTYQVASGIYSGNRQKSGRGAGVGAFGVGVIIIMILLKVLLLTSRNKSHQFDDFRLPPVEDSSGEPIVLYDSVIDPINEKAYQIQTENWDVDQKKDIAFDIGKTPFIPQSSIGLEKNLCFMNNTAKPVIVLFEGGRAIFLDAGDSDSTSSTNARFSIYTGAHPQMITYKDAAGNVSSGFRFKQFTAEDERMLSRVYKVNVPALTAKYTLEINPTDDMPELKAVVQESREYEILREAYGMD